MEGECLVSSAISLAIIHSVVSYSVVIVCGCYCSSFFQRTLLVLVIYFFRCCFNVTLGLFRCCFSVTLAHFRPFSETLGLFRVIYIYLRLIVVNHSCCHTNMLFLFTARYSLNFAFLSSSASHLAISINLVLGCRAQISVSTSQLYLLKMV